MLVQLQRLSISVSSSTASLRNISGNLPVCAVLRKVPSVCRQQQLVQSLRNTASTATGGTSSQDSAGARPTGAMVAAPAAAGRDAAPAWAQKAATELLKGQKGLPSSGALRDGVAARLASGAQGDAAPSDDVVRAQAADAETLLETFTSRRFSGAALEHMVENEPEILSRLQPEGAAEVLDILAKSCFLPNRVATLVEVTPRIMTDIPAATLRERIGHLKAATSPMGSQLAAMWEKDPKTLWLDTAAIDERLAWLQQLGVLTERIRFVYARLPALLTADKSRFQLQLDYLTGLQLDLGKLLEKRPHYLEWSVDRLQKAEAKLTAEYGERDGKRKRAAAAQADE